jgi:hypothetical protein
MSRDAVRQILQSLDCQRSIAFTTEDLEQWPEGIREAVSADGILRLGEPARAVVCDGCALRCLEDVEFIEGADGEPPRGFVVCEEPEGIGRVPVALERLQRWTIDLDAVAGLVSDRIGATGGVQEVAHQRLWWLGRLPHTEPVTDVFLARGAAWEDWDAVINQARRFRDCPAPLLLTFSQMPEERHMPGHASCLPLTRLLRLDGGVLSVDQSVIGDMVAQRRPAGVLGESVFQRQGQHWQIRYAGVSSTIRHTNGMLYVAHLLEHPGEPFHVGELRMLTDGSASTPDPFYSRMSGERLADDDLAVGVSGALRDPSGASGVHEYRKALRELASEIGAAERRGDSVACQELREHRKELASAFASSYGRHGERDALDPEQERARKAVCKAITRAIDRVEKQHGVLGRHLDKAVRRGTFCAYQPESPITWTT